jgi:hypothetical protein
VDGNGVWIRDHAGLANDVTKEPEVIIVDHTKSWVAHQGSVEGSLPCLFGMLAWPSPQSAHEGLC